MLHRSLPAATAGAVATMSRLGFQSLRRNSLSRVSSSVRMMSSLTDLLPGSHISRSLIEEDGIVVNSMYNMENLHQQSSVPLPLFLLDAYSKIDRQNTAAVIDAYSGAELTYPQLTNAVVSFADNLYHSGIRKGDRVAIVAPNHIHFLTSVLGVSLAGAISTTVNPLYTETEIGHQVDATGSKMVIAHPMVLEKVLKLRETRPDLQIIAMTNAPVPNDDYLRAAGVRFLHEIVHLQSYDIQVDHRANFHNFDPNTILTLPFSSGTTGLPKGVMLTHRNIVSNVLQTAAIERHAMSIDPTNPLMTGNVICPLPFFHIFGMTAGMYLSSYIGSRLYLTPNFDLEKFLQIIESKKINRGFVVPPIVLALAKHPLVDKFDLSSLQSLISGAAPLGADVQLAAAKRLNCSVRQGWGMTETSPVAALTPELSPENLHLVKGSSGALMPSTQGKIVHPATGEDLPCTSEGELLVRGPQVMLGYYQNEEATKKTIRPDGWMHTGDIGYFREDGLLFLTDRVKELIKYKGFQVPPAELEALLNSMDQVKDVVVIPVPDEEAGELPRAYVVLQDGYHNDAENPNKEKYVTPEQLMEFVDSRVAHYKRLRGGIRFIDVVPKSTAGKLLRREMIVKDRAMDGRV